MAARTGAPKDAWAIDSLAHHHAFATPIEVGVAKMVLLPAICVRKPLLAVQRAKLTLERELIGSGLT